jgi:hypothetical protein
MAGIILSQSSVRDGQLIVLPKDRLEAIGSQAKEAATAILHLVALIAESDQYSSKLPRVSEIFRILVLLNEKWKAFSQIFLND